MCYGVSMRGRKATPTALLKLHGSDQPRNAAEPIPSGNLADCPPHFDADQRAIWREAVAGAPPGLLRRIDASVVETWVIAVYLQRRALAELAEQKDGLGGPAAKRLLTTLARAAQTVVRCASEMGFSPASRPRTAVAAPWRPGPVVRGDDKPRMSIEEYLASAPRPKVAN